MDSPPPTKMDPPLHKMEESADDAGDDHPDQPLRRPMNAFLLFCKRHRRVVKSQHPWLDNRSCTKMLADMWAVLDSDEKNKYLQLARECKAAFMKAHPGYKWCGSSKQNVKPTSPTVTTRTKFPHTSPFDSGPEVQLAGQDRMGAPRSQMGITPGKLADPSEMGGLSLLLLAGQHAMGKTSPPPPPSSDALSTKDAITTDPSSDTKSRLFEFAEMCTNRQLIECESPSTTAPPSTQILPDKELNRTNKAEALSSLDIKNEPAVAMDLANNNNPVKMGLHSKSTSKDKKSHKRSKKRAKSDKKKKKSSHKSSCESKVSAASAKAEDMFASRVLDRKDDVAVKEEEEGAVDDKADNKNSSASYETEDKDGEPESPSGRRKSSRSCKGRLYREMVMGGMLESLQRPERPFNCKKPWRHGDSTCYSDGDDAVFEPEPEKPKRPSRRKSRKRTLSGCGLSLPADFDYGEIDVEARLATLPQYSPDQFQPKGKSCHRAKRSSSLYKNSTFVRKGDSPRSSTNSDGGRFSLPTSPSRTFYHSPLTGSQKRKARKSSIMHLTPSQEAKALNGNASNSNHADKYSPSFQPKSTRVRLEFNISAIDKDGKSLVTKATNNNNSSGSNKFLPTHSSSVMVSSSSSMPPQASSHSSAMLTNREPRSASQKPCSSLRTTSKSASLIGMQPTLTVP